MKGLWNWLDDRTGCGSVCTSFFCRPISKEARWRSLWSSLLIYNFLILLITGIFLSTTYSPSARSAWESTFFIQNEMILGWFIRGIHHFASQSMIILLAVFLLQIIVDRAYTAPRELVYWVTMILMLLCVGLAHTGYLLPWDQRGYQAAEVFTTIAGNSPGVGPQIREVIQGGPTKGNQTITRLYSIHTIILPFKIFVLFVIQQYLYRRIENKLEAEGNHERMPFWPDIFLRNSVAMLLLSFVLMGLTVIFHGADLTGPADPANPYSAARPEWYFLFLFKILKMTDVFIGAIVIPQVILIVFLLMPFIGRSKAGQKFNIAFICLFLVGVVTLTAWTLIEDANDENYQHAVEVAEKNAERVKELALSPTGIPAEGGLHLVYSDPLTQGAKLYASRCASCHHYNGHNGRGEKPTTPASAADLGNFGTKEWIRNVLIDYKTVFAPTENAKWKGKLVSDMFLKGEMAEWSEASAEILKKEKNKKHVDALVEFLYAQSNREGALDSKSEVMELGKEVYDFGELSSEDEVFDNGACVDCHTLIARDGSKLKSQGEGPTLTGYASKEWLISFLKNPSAEEHYGYSEDRNAMPAFEEQLSEKEIDLIVRWMMGDYFKPKSKAKTSEQKEESEVSKPEDGESKKSE